MNNLENLEKVPRWIWLIPIVMVIIGIVLIVWGIFSKYIPSISTASISSSISSSLSSLSTVIPRDDKDKSEPKEKPKTIDELCSSIVNPKIIEVTLPPNNRWSETVTLPNMAGKNFCFEGPITTEVTVSYTHLTLPTIYSV